METLSRNLRHWARNRGWTDAEVARRADLNGRRYANYAKGSREPDMATLVRLARVLGVTPNVLLGVTADDTAPPEMVRAVAALSALGPDDLMLAGDLLETIAARAAKRRDGE